MHKYARKWIDNDYTQTVQPWMFGDPESKRTALWLANLPSLIPTDIVEATARSVHRAAPNPLRNLMRSVTFPGIAAAMADQWSITP